MFDKNKGASVKHVTGFHKIWLLGLPDDSSKNWDEKKAWLLMDFF
jgi:hypothetical protein